MVKKQKLTELDEDEDLINFVEVLDKTQVIKSLLMTLKKRQSSLKECRKSDIDKKVFLIKVSSKRPEVRKNLLIKMRI